MLFTTRKVASLSAVAALACAASAHAQQPAAALPVAPPMTCEKPGDFMPLDRSDHRAMVRWQKGLDDYKACVSEYSRSNGAKANELAAQARVYSDAANKAIDDFNDYVHEVNAKANPNGDDKGKPNVPAGAAPTKY